MHHIQFLSVAHQTQHDIHNAVTGVVLFGLIGLRGPTRSARQILLLLNLLADIFAGKLETVATSSVYSFPLEYYVSAFRRRL